MNTILVATDFSADSHWGTDYALELARQLHAQLVVLHAYEPPATPTAAPNGVVLQGGVQYEEAVKKLCQLQSQMQNATNFPVDVSVVARPGSPATCLADEAINLKADLLVMGRSVARLAGDAPQKDRQLGRLATDIIPRTRVPMLLVPPGVAYHTPHTIGLTFDLANSMDVVALSNAEQFAQRLDVMLDIIGVADEPDKQLPKAANGVCTLLDNQSHKSHTFSLLPGNHLATALKTYSAQHKADLIMLLPKPCSRLRTFLLESDTQEIARLPEVPALGAVEVRAERLLMAPYRKDTGAKRKIIRPNQLNTRPHITTK
jgi:nucleotide-binding universal stress UspA family protein